MGNDKKHILVVEDNMAAAKAAQFLFEMLGCTVQHADDGDKAVKLAKANKYDIICMDIGLPTVSGTKACLAIREYEAENLLDSVPIIAVTGNCSPAEIKEYMAAGMQEVLSKPLTKEKAERLLSFCK